MLEKFKDNTPLQESENEKNEETQIEVSILFLKYNGVPDSEIIQSLKNPLSGKKGIPEEKIEQVFQRLRDYGFIDKDGFITQEGIDSLKDADI